MTDRDCYPFHWQLWISRLDHERRVTKNEVFMSESKISSASLARVLVLLLPICLGACGPDDPESKQSSEAQNRIKADADLMLDIGRAGTELERRLTETVRAEDGIVLVHGPITGRYMSQVLSPNTPWVLSCGAGISIVFGSSVSGAEGSTSNDVEVVLVYNSVDESDCSALGPRLGRRLNAIFREASAK
jgi:hypothetical protein